MKLTIPSVCPMPTAKDQMQWRKRGWTGLHELSKCRRRNKMPFLEGESLARSSRATKANLPFAKVKAMHCPAVGGAANPSPSNVNMYAHMHQKPAAVSNVRYSPYSRSPNYYMGPVDTNPAFSRQPYGVEHGVSYEDPPAAVYNGQAAAHMLPSTPQGVWNDYYGLTWNPRGWNTNEAAFPDQGTENPLIQSAYTYMLAGQGTHRNIPNPTSQAQLMTPSPEVTSGLPYSPEYRASGSPWEQKCDATTHRGSMQSITNESFPTSPENHIKPDPGTQDMVLGYVPAIPSQDTTTIPNGTYPALDTVNPATAGDFQTPPDTQFMRAFSRDSNGRLLSIGTSSDYSPSDSYHHSSNGSNSGSERGRTHSEASDSSPTTLVNGLPYSPVKQVDAHAQSGLQFNLMASDAMTDYHPEMQRALQSY